MEVRKGRRCVFMLHAHLIFITKYRGKVFTDTHLKTLERICRNVCSDFDVELEQFNLNSAVGRYNFSTDLGSKALAVYLSITFWVNRVPLCRFLKNLSALGCVAPFAKGYGHWLQAAPCRVHWDFPENRHPTAEFRFNGEQDHIHLLVNYPPKVSVSKLVNSLKGVSSRKLKLYHPELIKPAYMKNALWSPSYFAGSCGGAPIEVLKQYIEQQNRPH